MKLYHYSKDLHQTLLSKRRSGKASAEEIKQSEKAATRAFTPEAPYVDHISFFFEPIPSAVLPQLFGNGHPVWFKGNQLFEYTFNPAMLPDKVLYSVVESERVIKLFDDFVIENNWEYDNPELLKKWFILEHQKKVEWGEYGTQLNKLLAQVKKHQNTISTSFLKAVNREDFKENFTKYAACVPHLMLYPENGEITFESVRRVTLGDNKRHPV